MDNLILARKVGSFRVLPILFVLGFLISNPSSLLSNKTFDFILKWLRIRRSRLKLVHQNYEELCRQLFVFDQINRGKDD